MEDLPVLAELRGRGEIRVLIAGDVAWISWKPGSELMEALLVRRILPLGDAVLYTERDGAGIDWGSICPHSMYRQGMRRSGRCWNGRFSLSR